jgi:transmembrane protein
MTPNWVAATLQSRSFLLLARIVLTTPFWGAGIQHLVQYQTIPGEMAHFGLNPALPYAVALIVTLFAGSALVIAGGKWSWLGAGWLGVFTALTIPICHAFWNMQGAEAMSEFRTVMEHISIIGGLMVMAILDHVDVRAPAGGRLTGAPAPAPQG